jgi:hypothetical protein
LKSNFAESSAASGASAPDRFAVLSKASCGINWTQIRHFQPTFIRFLIAFWQQNTSIEYYGIN